MEVKKGKWVTRQAVPQASECGGCNVVHADFGGRPSSTAPAELTAREIAGLREIFVSCPAARRALVRSGP